MLSSKSLRVAAVLVAPLALAACGKSNTEAKTPIKQYIVTSAVDCSDNANLSYEDCTAIIEKAVEAHTKEAATYTSMKNCEKTEGAGKCERVDETSYRPRLVAFQLAMSEPPVATPLYAPKTDEVGFRTASNTALSVENESYTFSKSAVHASEAFASGMKNGGGVASPF